MANSNEEPTKTSPKAEDNRLQQDKIAATNPKTVKSTSNSVILTLPIVLAIIALASALYANYSVQQSRQSSIQQTEHLNALLTDLKQQQLDTKNRLTTMTETANQTQSTLQEQVKDLSKNLQLAMQQRLYQKQDWLILKARYYLELAQINAHWSDDQQATIALLQQADALLVSMPDQQLFAVRQAIASEIAKLQTLPKIDVSGLLSQLDAAQTMTANLPIKQPFNNAKTNNEIKSEDKPSSPWREKLKDSMSALEKLVVIRRNDTDIQPLLSPSDETLLRDSIRLSLQEAQLAILQHSPEVYQLSLTRALKDIQSAFDQNAVATQALVKKLQALQQEKLIVTKPVLEESLPLLNKWIESKNSQTMDASAAMEGDKAQ